MDDRDQLLDALEREVRLEAARVDGTTSKVITPSLTRVVAETLLRNGLTVQLEYPMPYDGHRGRVDVVALSPTTGALQIAVEIDIGFKLKSLRKLEEATRAGARAFWLRWGEFAPWESSRVPDEYPARRGPDHHPGFARIRPSHHPAAGACERGRGRCSQWLAATAS